MPVDYIVDPGQARTDLYGIGKGLAQVIDLSPTRRAAEVAQAREDKKAEDRAAKEEALISSIAGLGKGDVRPNDLGYFAQKQKEVADLTKQKFYKNKGALSIEDQLEIESAIASIKQQAYVSKDAREQAEALHKAAILNPEKYDDEEEVKAINDYLYSPEKAGQWDSMPTLTERFDYGAHVLKDLQPKAKAWGDMHNERGYERFTEEQANELIAQDLQDPIKFKAVAKQYNKAPDKLGATNPVEYAQRLYAKDLTVDNKPQLQQWQVYGPGDREKKVSNVDFQRTDNEDNLYINQPKPIAIELNGKKMVVTMNNVVRNPKTGEIIGKATRELTPDEIKEAKIKGQAQYERDLAAYKAKYGSMQNGLAEGIPYPTPSDEKYQVPVSKTVNLDYGQVRRIAKTVYGWDNLQKTFQNGEAPEGTDMSVNDTRTKSDGGNKKEDLRKKYNY